MYVPNVSYVFIRMLQLFYLDIAKVDLDIAYTCMLQAMFQVFQVYVASVSSGCCICFTMVTHVCFLVFQTYVASVSTVSSICCGISSKCCKSRSDAAHIAVGPIYSSRLLQLLGLRACAWE